MFGHNKWLEGKSPKDIVPHLFSLAHFKKRTVEKELHYKNWIHAVRRISTAEELQEFINLWMLVRNVDLNQAEKTQSFGSGHQKEYMMGSAYKIQFRGFHASFQVRNLWKARAEPKVKVFGWTAMHQRIRTADNLASRGMQLSPMCPLCNSNLEDACHLLINCHFTREVFRFIWSWFHL
jgi:hypothetical protein